jgi:hypothetical protein
MSEPRKVWSVSAEVGINSLRSHSTVGEVLVDTLGGIPGSFGSILIAALPSVATSTGTQDESGISESKSPKSDTAEERVTLPM